MLESYDRITRDGRRVTIELSPDVLVAPPELFAMSPEDISRALTDTYARFFGKLLGEDHSASMGAHA